MLVVLFSSCLKHDLPEIIESSQNTINSFSFQHRYMDTVYVAAGTANADTLVRVRMSTLTNRTTFSNDTIYCRPSLANNFPAAQRSKVTITNLWATATIPNAAIIEPINGAPALGTPGDFSNNVSYKVTAANGEYRIYVIVTTPIP